MARVKQSQIKIMTKILLVEDNEMNRDMLSRRLERKGYDVILAVDGSSGIQLASAASPDLVACHRLISG